MKKYLFLIICTLCVNVFAQPFKTKNVILVTIDGLRWEEVFTGADTSIISTKEYVHNKDGIRKKYWTDNASDRRKLLFPFFWETIATKGQLYGNRLAGSNVNVENPHWFSYPGYNEILTGIADPKINSNEFGPNPNTNFLEFLNKLPTFKGKIAAFSSWDEFPDIINEKRSGVLVNSAIEKVTELPGNAKVELINKLITQLPDFLEGVRLDALTFNVGFEYLKQQKPRVLYLAFDETDDFAHEGRYDLYLNAAHYTDSFLAELWSWIQSTPGYKDQTTMLITCDHGRGNDNENWRHHGAKTANSSETWFAVIGPDTPAKGEIKEGQYYNKQYAKTLSTLLGVDYTNDRPVGENIASVLGK